MHVHNAGTGKKDLPPPLVERREREREAALYVTSTNTDTQCHALSLMVSDAGYLGKEVFIGAEETKECKESKFRWNDGTPLAAMTSIWKHPTAEGFDPGNHCTGVSTTYLIMDLNCSARAFVCQYDV